MEPVVLRTERLELSIPSEADIDPMFEACQDRAIQRYTTVPSPYLREHAESFVAQIPKDWEAGNNLTWGIHEGGHLVGTIGLYRIDGRGAGEIGYWIAPWARRRGVLSEAADAVITWGFAADGCGLARIEWRAVVGNAGSARAARALGFRYEGMLRQALWNANAPRDDGWVAGLLAGDDRTPQPWPVLDTVDEAV
ncbi:GNAT family N-acetyltransferase [Microbacterium sp. BWT-B31]|uniref:GNAT family N-acetyltransferase n=1 Tax=Microbacterium sp. BWT-B31 TaxID=3232072 RepID=UPI003528230E